MRFFNRTSGWRMLRTLPIALFVLASLFVLQAKGAIITGPIYNADNGHSYYLLTTGNWHAAEAEAITLGGHLAAINNAVEQNFVTSTFLQFGGTPRPLWIGLNDLAVEGTFVWSNGDPVTYTNWGPGEPNNFNGIEDAVYIQDVNFEGLTPTVWNDNPVTSITKYGLVEVVPEPSAVAILCLTGVGLICRRRRRFSSYA